MSSLDSSDLGDPPLSFHQLWGHVVGCTNKLQYENERKLITCLDSYYKEDNKKNYPLTM